MPNQTAFSIITPTLNQSKFIGKTIASLLAQKVPSVQYRVVDGGSIDGTIEILKLFGSALEFRVDPTLNQSAAINAGWRSTQGEIIAWINSDDLYMPGALKTVAAFFTKNPEVDLVYGDCAYIDTDGNFIRDYPTRSFDFRELLAKTINYIPQPAVFFRRRLLDEVGFLDESLNYVMDFDYWLRVGRNHRIVYLPEKLAALRLQPEAKSIARLSDFGAELVRIYQKFFEADGDRGLYADLKNEAMANIYYRAADCAFWGRDVHQAREFARKAIQTRKRPFKGLWAWILLGKFGRNVASLLFENPYTR